MSIEEIEELGFILVPKPPYSPDLAPCDFFLSYLHAVQFAKGGIGSALTSVHCQLIYFWDNRIFPFSSSMGSIESGCKSWMQFSINN
jgi:hypothetical protein